MTADQNTIRVIHVFQQTSAGSVPTVVHDLNEFLPHQGIESSLLYLNDDGVFKHVKSDQEVTVCRRDKKAGFDFRLVFKLARYFKLKKVQVVHIHDDQLIPTLGLAAKLAGVKLFFTQHGVVNKKVKKCWFELNQTVIFNSSYVQQDFLKSYKLSPQKCRVIRDGFNIARFQQSRKNARRDELKKQAGLTSEHFILGNMGGLWENQDQASLLKAFRKLAKKAPHMVLVLVGDGPVKPELEKLIKEFNLEERVKFVPQQEQSDPWMELFHIFILSANVENYSHYISEAMASAKPVIATKIGSQAELLNDDIGFLVPCAFPERIESAVMRLYANQALIQKMGDKAREYLTDKLSMDRMAVEYAALYRSKL